MAQEKLLPGKWLKHAIEINVAVSHEMPLILKEHEEVYRIYKLEFEMFEGDFRLPKPCLSIELHAHTGSTLLNVFSGRRNTLRNNSLIHQGGAQELCYHSIASFGLHYSCEMLNSCSITKIQLGNLQNNREYHT